MYMTGFKLALDPYIAAVSPAGPEPMMTSFSSDSMSRNPREWLINVCECEGD